MRLAHVRERVSRSAQSVGRTVDEVRLIAVSKRQPNEVVEEAYRFGIRDFGENTAQGLQARARYFDSKGLRGARWHFVGSLQRNKVKLVEPLAYRIHSLDRLSLAESLARRAAGRVVEVLLQVNIGREPQKAGVAPEELSKFAHSVRQVPEIRVRGLMGMPPFGVDPSPYYRELGRLFGQLGREMPPDLFTELSMGMSGDFETAIRYGATHIRVGTAIFGERPLRSET